MLMEILDKLNLLDYLYMIKAYCLKCKIFAENKNIRFSSSSMVGMILSIFCAVYYSKEDKFFE